MSALIDFRTFAGPGDRDLGGANSELAGYQPVSRVGEIVINAFVDPYIWSLLGHTGVINEERIPDYAAWATATPGMVALARKKRTNMRQLVAAETAVPCLVCASGLGHLPDNADQKERQMSEFFFAGVVRSKSIRQQNDGIGPRGEDHFTLSLGGMVTLLNNGREKISPGDLVAWTFEPGNTDLGNSNNYLARKGTVGARRVAIEPVEPFDVGHERVFARALSFARPGETIDVLLQQ